MDKEEEIKKERKNLEEKLKNREEAFQAHSFKPQQMLIIDELEIAIAEKKIAGLRPG